MLFEPAGRFVTAKGRYMAESASSFGRKWESLVDLGNSEPFVRYRHRTDISRIALRIVKSSCAQLSMNDRINVIKAP